MQTLEKTLIMKFGGAAVSTAESFDRIAELIISKSFDYPNIVIVVSAMGGMTDHLISLAKQVHPHPPKREYDMLVSVGERISIALLAMALSKRNFEGVSFTGSQSGIITCENHTDAKILDVKPERILKALKEKKIAIVAGFQGVSVQKEITTLGRGGSDTTAVALGIALDADRVEFYKDVSGIFQEDPKINPEAKHFSQLDYEQALEIITKTGGKVLHPRALTLAKKNGLPLVVQSFSEGSSLKTAISSSPHFQEKMIKNSSFELSSLDSEEFAPQVLQFSNEANDKAPFASQKTARDASKLPECEEEKLKTQVKRKWYESSNSASSKTL